MSETETLLEFPCPFPVKAMGKNSGEFEALVSQIIFNHAELHDGEEVTSRASGSDNYLSVTVMITATSRDQLDRIYEDLTASELVLMAL